MCVWLWLMRTLASCSPLHTVTIMSSSTPLSSGTTSMGVSAAKRSMSRIWSGVTFPSASSPAPSSPATMPAATAARMPFWPPVLGTVTLLTFLMMFPLTCARTRSGIRPRACRALAAQ